MYGRIYLDYHADTTVTGYNCCILYYTGKEGGASPYRDNNEAIKGVPIVHVETDWQSLDTSQAYIFVLNEAIWMGYTLDHTLVNPNQLRHYRT